MSQRRGSLVSRLRRLKLRKIVQGVQNVAHSISGGAIQVAERAERVSAAVGEGERTFDDPAGAIGGTDRLVMLGLGVLVVVLLMRRS